MDAVKTMENHHSPLIVVIGTIIALVLNFVHPPPPDVWLGMLSIFGKGLLSGAGVVVSKWIIEGIKARIEAHKQKERERLRITDKE